MRYSCAVIRFPVTQRSVLERIRSVDDEVRRSAFGDLAEGYWRPSYHYLRLQWHLTPQEAEDAVQAFFTAAFEKGYVEKYDPAKAKFRTFLRVCLDRFAQNLQQSERAAKRGGDAAHLSLDFPGAEHELAAVAATDRRDLDRFFHDETIRFLFARAVDEMRLHYGREGREIIFRVFEQHDLHPSAQTTYATVARDLDIPVTQVNNHLHAARRRFRELALEHLRGIVATESEYQSEARALFGIDVRP
jgi:DNA-directed RNA polymerase specialized sigma24 family protein